MSKFDNLVKKRPGELSFVTWCKRRVKRNQNVISLTTGQTGSGKSYTDLSIAEQIDPDFSIKQVAFSLKEVMRIINSDWFNEKKFKIIIFEEMQVEASNREWQSLTNKLVNYLLSTFRNQNIILFINAPYRDFIDSHTRKLLHAVIEMRGIDRKEKKAKARILLQQYNDKVSKWYEHSLHTIIEEGGKNKVKKISMTKVPKPSKELIKVYEKKKTEFTDNLNKDILKQLEQKDKKIDTRKPLTNQQREILMAMKECETQEEVSERLKIDRGQVSRQLKSARNKGYTPENVDFE